MVYYILWCNSLFAGTYRDRNTVFVGATYKYNVLIFKAQIAHVDICRDIDAR